MLKFINSHLEILSSYASLTKKIAGAMKNMLLVSVNGDAWDKIRWVEQHNLPKIYLIPKCFILDDFTTLT